MMARHIFPLLLALLLRGGLAHADTLYKCIDDSGVVLYTNQKGGGKNCKVLSRDLPVSTYAAPKQEQRGAAPGDFPRVNEDTQKGRDADRRKILEQELATEQQNRLPFQALLPGLVNLEHRPGAGAEGAVVEEDDIWVEQE